MGVLDTIKNRNRNYNGINYLFLLKYSGIVELYGRNHICDLIKMLVDFDHPNSIKLVIHKKKYVLNKYPNLAELARQLVEQERQRAERLRERIFSTSSSDWSSDSDTS